MGQDTHEGKGQEEHVNGVVVVIVVGWVGGIYDVCM